MFRPPFALRVILAGVSNLSDENAEGSRVISLGAIFGSIYAITDGGETPGISSFEASSAPLQRYS